MKKLTLIYKCSLCGERKELTQETTVASEYYLKTHFGEIEGVHKCNFAGEGVYTGLFQLIAIRG